MGDFHFAIGTRPPPQLGVCRYCDHYLAAADMGNGIAAIIPSYADPGYSWEHACSNRDNPGNTHELADTDWFVLKSQAGRTTYHSRRPSGRWRLAVIRVSGLDGEDTLWRWSIYDMTAGSKTGGLLWHSAYTDTWQQARRAADDCYENEVQS